MAKAILFISFILIGSIANVKQVVLNEACKEYEHKDNAIFNSDYINATNRKEVVLSKKKVFK